MDQLPGGLWSFHLPERTRQIIAHRSQVTMAEGKQPFAFCQHPTYYFEQICWEIQRQAGSWMLNYGVQSAVSKFRENQPFLNKFRELVSAEFRENQQFSNKYLQFLKENSQ